MRDLTRVYDDPTYRAIKKIYEGPGWANDIDELARTISFSKTRFVTPRTTTKSGWPPNRNGAASG